MKNGSKDAIRIKKILKSVGNKNTTVYNRIRLIRLDTIYTDNDNDNDKGLKELSAMKRTY